MDMMKLKSRPIAVDIERMVQWREKNAYLALLRNCADCGNPHANFSLGLDEIYNSRNVTSGLQHLLRAMHGGHLTAAYLMGMVLFRHASTRCDAMKILDRVSSGNLYGATNVTKCTISGNPIVDRCRRESLEKLWRCWKKNWEMKPRLRCDHQLCGRVVSSRGSDCWVKDDILPRAFCSQLCRWTYEAQLFFGSI